ncbi:MAG: hypothetical protein KG012_15785 [Deltaproteobacteria bacterium]|nr:hypothetical protein [Deltaproteobacteria bacterium]
MNLSIDQLLEISQYSIVRLDGAWFLALAGKLGKEKHGRWMSKRGNSSPMCLEK